MIINILNIGLVSTDVGDVVERGTSGAKYPNLRDHGIRR